MQEPCLIAQPKHPREVFSGVLCQAMSLTVWKSAVSPVSPEHSCTHACLTLTVLLPCSTQGLEE